MFSKEKQNKPHDKVANWYPNDADYIDINNVSIAVPSLEFNIEFIFLHIYKHLIDEEIGLRQLCDLALISNQNRINVNNLIAHREGWEIIESTLIT